MFGPIRPGHDMAPKHSIVDMFLAPTGGPCGPRVGAAVLEQIPGDVPLLGLLAVVVSSPAPASGIH